MAVRRESQAVHPGGMSMQCHPIAALSDIPQPDRFVEAATGQDAAIGTPSHLIHSICVSCKRLEQGSAGHTPQPDGAIPTGTGQNTAIGGKGQSAHPVGMPLQYLSAGSWLRLLHLPPPNLSRRAATGEQ